MASPKIEAHVEIVEARQEHLPFIAWVELTAARSHLERSIWDVYVDGTEAECLRFLEAFASTETRHLGHYTNFIVAEDGGRPAAALCGYFDAEHGGTAVLAGLVEAGGAVGRSAEDDATARERAGSFMRCSGGLKRVEGTWIVEWVATLPEFRRRGLVHRLLQEILDVGRAKGATTAEIGVLIGNDPAQRAYEKSGFAVVQESRDAEFEAMYGCPGMRLLRRQL